MHTEKDAATTQPCVYWPGFGEPLPDLIPGAISRLFLLRVNPLVRPCELDGHIRKEDMRRRAVRHTAMLS